MVMCRGVVRALFFLVLFVAGLSYVTAAEQDDSVALRPADISVMLNFGKSGNIDTYLSQLRYEGKRMEIRAEFLRAAKFSLCSAAFAACIFS